MRDIKFRGLREEYDPQWHKSPFQFGHLLNVNSIGVWGNSDYYEYTDVLPETVGQFTGLHDKNGTEIYEGDVVKHEVVYMSEFGNQNKDASKFYEVVWGVGELGIAGFYLKHNNRLLHSTMYYLEIIGNIHQNPELLNPKL